MNRTLIASLLVLAAIFAGPVIPIYELPAESFASSEILQLLKDAGCTLCDDLSECIQGDMMLAPNEGMFTLDVIFYNGTVARTPITNAPLIIYVHNETTEELSKIYTGSDGVASFSFEQWSGSCHDYIVFHCKGQYGCDFTTCVDAVGINRTDLGVEDLDDIPLAPDGTMSGGEQDPLNVLPTYASYRYCPPPPVLGDSMPVFCLPLVLIMMFLLGSMFLSGKNPFIFFDFSSPRMGKYIRYTARGRGFGFDMVSIASAAVTVVSIAKNPKGMAAKDKKALKSGGAFGGVAAGVRGGVLSTKGGLRGIKKGGGLKGLKKLGAGAVVWNTVKGKATGSAIGQIVSSTRGAWSKGGTAGGLKALGLALAQYSSFGQLVNAIQTAALMWSIDKSIPAALRNLNNWSGVVKVVDKDGKLKEVEASFNGKEMVFRVYDVNESGGRVEGSGKIVAYKGLVESIGPKGLSQVVALRTEGFGQLAKYHRTVLFFAPLEIADRKTELAATIKTSLKSADKDTTFTYSDPATGTKTKITAGEFREIAGSESGAGVIAITTGADGKKTTQIVSQDRFDEMQKNPPKGTFRVESGGAMDLSRIVTGLDPKSKEVKAFGLGGLVPEATKINSMSQMVAASAVMYKQLEQIQANHASQFNARREDLSAKIKALDSEGLGASVTISGETKTVADWLKSGKMDLVVTTLASDPSTAPKALSSLAKSASNLYNAESVQMGNLASIFKNTSQFGAMLSSDKENVGLTAWNLKGNDLLKAQVHAQLTVTQLTAVSQGRTFDVSLLDSLDFSKAKTQPAPQNLAMLAQAGGLSASGVLGDKGKEFLKSFEENKKKLEAIPAEYRNPEQNRQLEMYGVISDAVKTQQKITAAKDPEVRAGLQETMKKTLTNLAQLGTADLGVTERQGLMYKSQALENLAKMFTTAAPAKDTAGYRLERAAYDAMYDISRNPEQSLKTLGLFQGLMNVKDDPARFNAMAEGLQNYSLTDDPKQRDSMYKKLQVQDATNRFGDEVRIKAMSSHGGAEDAMQAAVDNLRKQRIAAAPYGEDTQTAARTPFIAIDNERKEYKAAEDNWLKKSKEREDAQKKGMAGPAYDKLLVEESRALAAFEKERKDYYEASFSVLGGSKSVDPIIERTVPPGSKEHGMWKSYQNFTQHAAAAPDIAAADDFLAKFARNKDLSLNKDDPFRSMRTGTADKVGSFQTAIGLMPPSMPGFSYSAVPQVHEEVFGGVAASRQMSIAELRAQMGR